MCRPEWEVGGPRREVGGPRQEVGGPIQKVDGGNHVEMKEEEGQLIEQYFTSNCSAIWTVPCELLELGYHHVE